MRIVVANNKGGVGKTFVTALVGEALARLGRRVLLVDMDPQANLTGKMRVAPGVVEGHGPIDELHTLTRCLAPGAVRNGAAADYLYSCQWPQEFAARIDVLPSDLDLEDRAIEAGLPGAVNRLRKALYGVDDEYDVTLIDCMPSLKGHLTGMALATLDSPGDAVIVPLIPEKYAIAGALRTVAYLRSYREDLGIPHAEVAGLVVNGVRAGTDLHRSRIAQLADTFPDVPVLGEPIPLRTRVAETQDADTALLDERSLGAAAAGGVASGVVASAYAIADAILAREAVAA